MRDCPDLSARRRDQGGVPVGAVARRRRRSATAGADRPGASGGVAAARARAGGAARAVGRKAATARLDPAHRRDGLGLAVVALAVVTGVALWSSGGGPVGRIVHDLLRGGFGTLAVVLPVLFLAAGLHLLRQLPKPEERGRVGVGWAALAVAATGLFHLGNGRPAHGAGRDGAGGLLGAWVAGPLQRGVGTALAVLLLVLVLFFGLLVVTKTPVNRIPHRIRAARDRLLRRPPPEAGPQEAGRAADRGRRPRSSPARRYGCARPSRRRQGSLPDPADPDPYDRRRGRRCRPRPQRRRRPPRWARRQATRGAGPRSSPRSRARCSSALTGPRRHYTLPSSALLSGGTPPEGRRPRPTTR